MKNKIVSAAFICAFLCSSSADIVYSAENLAMQEAVNSQFTVRVEKENFEEVPESIILDNQNNKLNLNKILSPLSAEGSFLGDDIVSFEKKIDNSKKHVPVDAIANNDKEKPKSYDDSGIQPNILNVNLAYLRTQNVIKSYGTFQPNDKFASYSVVTNKNLNPDEFKKSINQIKTLLSKGMNSEAEDLLDEISSYNLETCWDLAEVAGIFENIGEHQKASKIYERAVAKNPKRIEILYSYSLSLYKIDKFDEAENALKKVIKLNSEFTLAYYNLGNIYYKKNQFYSALDSYNKAIKLNPMSMDSYYNAALALEALNHKELAAKYFYECLKLKPEDPQSLKALARLNKSS